MDRPSWLIKRYRPPPRSARRAWASPSLLIPHGRPLLVQRFGLGGLLGQRRLGNGPIPESNSLLDAPALLRGAELLEQEFEASLPSIRRLVVVVHMPIVPGARTPRSSKRDNSKDSRGPTSSRGAA